MQSRTGLFKDHREHLDDLQIGMPDFAHELEQGTQLLGDLAAFDQ